MINTLLESNKKLIDALEKDHQLRRKLEKSGKLFKGYDPAMRRCHEENAEFLQNYIARYGWPFPSKFGHDLHETAWFIAAHAISKPRLLKQALSILENALKEGEKVAPEYAKLFDRIAIYEGRNQVYGTQFFPSNNGFYARDLFDPNNVDQRRTSIGLSKFEEGKKEVGADVGGVITEEEEKEFEKDFIRFLKEVGWRT